MHGIFLIIDIRKTLFLAKLKIFKLLFMIYINKINYSIYFNILLNDFLLFFLYEALIL